MRGRTLFAAGVLALSATMIATAVVPGTMRTSISSTGVQASLGAEFPVVSQNGRWTAFQSAAPNLVSGDTLGLQDVFVHDAKTGQTIRIAPPGVEPDGASQNPSMSGDGRWITFSSRADNLVPGAATASDQVFLYDRQTGAIRRISSVAGGAPAPGESLTPRVSSDGTAVVFTSWANGLVAEDTNGNDDIFLYRVADGSIVRVSAPAAGGEPNNSASFFPAVSDGGRFVVFASYATNLDAAGEPAPSDLDIFVRDTQANTIARASVTSAGGLANAGAQLPSISADGCVVAFHSAASNLVAGDMVAGNKLFVRDRCSGTTEIASLGNGTPAPAGTVLQERPPAVSDDGCLIGMISANVIPIPGGWRGVAVRDRCQGFTSRIDLSTGGEGGIGHTNGPSFSAGSARYVAFHSGAVNLVVGTDTNGVLSDTFVRDRANATPPVAALRVSASGRRASADASASSDPDADVASTTISFGDGTPAQPGVTLTHDYARAGTYTVTATVVDTDGLTSTATAAVTVSDPPPAVPQTPPPPAGSGGGVAPVLSKASLAPRRFATVAVGARPGGRAGSKLTITVNRAATLTLRYERIRAGRLKSGRCLAGGPGRPCERYIAAGSPVTATLLPGVNRIPLSGRTRAGKLAPGKYRLTLVAVAPDGRRSKPLRLVLTIVR